MSHRVAALATVMVAAVGLSACGQSSYCSAVERSQKSLNAFGSDRSDDAFAGYARTMRSIAKQAPESSKKNWNTLATVTQDVLDAHEQVGISMQDMTNAKKRDALSQGDIKVLNKAYAAFNDTTSARKAVVKNVQEECDISLQ